MCENCSKLAVKTPEQRNFCDWCRSNVFILNFEQISHNVKVLPLVTEAATGGVL